ncbi:T9SS type A sorting domain-containing protein [Flavobacteriales bacterium]|nr:T9SS type A sorting domain-containing protein [Flavobacteriales bacterium]
MLTLLIGFSQANAQWHQVNTNTTENLYDIFFVDSLEGYCVGGSDDWGTPQSTGVILKTTDGGENWNTIFSPDGLTIKNIAIVDASGDKKLYAFGLDNGASYLVSTFTNTTFQNWSITPINYKPNEVKVYNNEIFYLDFTFGEGLKKISASIVYDVIDNPSILNYHLNQDGVTFINMNLDSIFVSFDFGATIQPLQSWSSSIIGQNQSLGAVVHRRNDTLTIKGTYPSTVVFSFDNGNTWNYFNGGGEGKSLILETGQIISLHLNSNKILTTNNFGQNWSEDTINGVVFLDIGYSEYNNSAFALGKNGIMYKNSILNTVGINEGRNLKKKINIYPNPTKHVLQIEILNDIIIESIDLFDVGGKKMKTFGKNERTIDVSGLVSGTYFLKISIQEGEITKKILIE